MIEQIKQIFHTKNGDWDWGEWHYFLAGFYIGGMINFIIGAIVMIIFLKVT